MHPCSNQGMPPTDTKPMLNVYNSWLNIGYARRGEWHAHNNQHQKVVLKSKKKCEVSVVKDALDSMNLQVKLTAKDINIPNVFVQNLEVVITVHRTLQSDPNW